MKRTALFGLSLLLLAACGGGNGGNTTSNLKAPLEGIDQIESKFFALEKENSDVREFDWKEAYNAAKGELETFMSAHIGETLPTTLSAGITAPLLEPFTITKAGGNVGRSTADPFVVFTAKLQTEEKLSLGYIFRDKDGLPVYAGFCDVKDGEAKVEMVFPMASKSREYLAEAARIKASAVQVELMTLDQLDARVLSCKGWGKKGFDKVVLDGKVADVPDALPGVYDKKELVVTTEWEDGDEFEVPQMILSLGEEKVAVVNHYDGKIHYIEIVSPRVFALSPSDSYHGSIPLHALSSALILLGADGTSGKMETNDHYMEVPKVALGKARFNGIQLKEGARPGRSFHLDDLAEGSHATSVSFLN